jgi:drug/metabolite transporter (DMT)-like permease
MLLCVYTSVRHLPLVYVALISNIGPLFIAIFSYMIFAKGLSRNEIISLVVAFGGVCILVTGGFNKNESKKY